MPLPPIRPAAPRPLRPQTQPAPKPAVRAGGSAVRPALEKRLRSYETDSSIRGLLSPFYSEEHLRPWARGMPNDPGKHFYRGAFLNTEQLLGVLAQGFSAKRSHCDEVYFTADPADAMSYALPAHRMGVEGAPTRGIVAVFQVGADRLCEPGQSPRHKTAGYRRNVPASWFTGVWVLDPQAKSEARRFVKLA
jgi:hypothetical protein